MLCKVALGAWLVIVSALSVWHPACAAPQTYSFTLEYDATRSATLFEDLPTDSSLRALGRRISGQFTIPPFPIREFRFSHGAYYYFSLTPATVIGENGPVDLYFSQIDLINGDAENGLNDYFILYLMQTPVTSAPRDGSIYQITFGFSGNQSLFSSSDMPSSFPDYLTSDPGPYGGNNGEGSEALWRSGTLSAVSFLRYEVVRFVSADEDVAVNAPSTIILAATAAGLSLRRRLGWKRRVPGKQS